MKILYIEGCNYIDFPVGGQLTFATQMLKVFKNELSLVGFVTDDFPIGTWGRRNINGIEYDFFALFNASKSAKMPLMPRRLRVFFALIKYKKKIIQKEADQVFTRSPEVIIPISKWGFKKLCYYIAGTGNPLAISRRKYARLFAGLYDRIYFPALKKVSVILAAADSKNIKDFISRSRNNLKDGDVKLFPTRIDSSIFNKNDLALCREKLDIDKEKTVISTSGRLHWIKGWKLMLDSYLIFLQQKPDSVFYLIGDGNDRIAIETYIAENNLEGKVVLLGFQSHEVIADYINASNLFVMGSVMEGWATSLVEAKACGTPVCTTNFSSAKELINSGVDGYIVEEREPKLFVAKMLEALYLKIDSAKLQADMQKYSLSNLKKDFLKACNFAE